MSTLPNAVSGATGARQFGRSWKLTINTVPSETGIQQKITALSNSWSPEPLHITFETFQSVNSALWYADISIYNLDSSTLNAVITQGMTVVLEAGYMNQPYGVIFEGTIFQPLWERENVTDFKLTLHCIVGFITNGNNFSAQSFAKGLTQRQLVARMATGASTPIPLVINAEADSELSQTTQSRGGIIFGQPDTYFEQATKYSGLNTWQSNAQASIIALRQSKTAPTVKFGVGNGLLGTPQQTQFGVDCRVLLDPRITPATQIYLDQTSLTVRQLPLSANGTTYPSILSQSGYYAVLAVRHIGDSRGNTWETQVTGSLYSDELLEALKAW